MRTTTAIFFALAAVIPSHAEDPTKFKVGAFEFSRPADWKWIQPSSTMRKAQLQFLPKAGGRSADITFFYFGEQGGDVQANTQRWFGQFTTTPDANKTETQEIEGVKVTIVTTEGTMKASPFTGVPEDVPDSALLGAILEHATGPVFVKMTGPAALVKESREKFMVLVKSAADKK